MTDTTPQADVLSLQDRLALLSGRNHWQTQDLPGHGVLPVRLADGPHGLRVQGAANDHLGLAPSIPATCFPPAVTMASSWDPELVEEVAAAVGREARALGVGVVLGPGMNIKRHPAGGRNFEYFSEDPLLSGVLASAAVRGIQAQGVGACVKHFAVNNQEHRRFVTDVVIDERTLNELYLRGFEKVVREAAPRMIMAAYNGVNGTICAQNERLLTAVLRARWGFTGAVVSDWGGVADAAASAAAGLDLEMPSLLPRGRQLQTAIAEGRLREADVVASSQRILELQDLAFPAGAERLPAELVVQHDALARRAAAAGSVVLTNNGVLPLTGTERVALIGAFAETPRYQGSGSSVVVPTQLTTARDAFAAAGIDLTYAPGYDPLTADRDDALIAEAVRVARDADVAVVMVGLPGSCETEGIDRDDLALPAQHDALVEAVAATNARTVVVLSNGSPLLLPWQHRVGAILECYLGGQASGGALVDALTGVVEPSGRLAETFPAHPADISSDPWFPGGDRQVQYREGVFVGYRYGATVGVRPAFPFGHGLGYGSTEWSDARLDSGRLDAAGAVTVSVTVRNTGTRATNEVVQVYATDRSGVVLRPRRELVGFTRMAVPAGDERVAEIRVAGQDLAFWDTRADDWRVPTGAFELHVARSSDLVEHTLRIEVTGQVHDSAEPPATPPVSTDDAAFARRLGHIIPAEPPARPFTRNSTMSDLQTTAPGRVFRRLIDGAGNLDPQTKADPVAMRLVRRSTDEMPIRALVPFSQGKLPWRVADTVIALANGSIRELWRAWAGRPGKDGPSGAGDAPVRQTDRRS